MLLAHAYSANSPKRRLFTCCGAWLTSVVSAVIIIAQSSAFAASAAPIDPSGLWSTKDDESIIRIGPCTPPPGSPPASATTVSPYCGTLVWLKEPLEKGVPKTDSSNPDKEKRSRPLIGIELLKELAADSDHWKGKAYNADDGKIYDITFKVLPDKAKGDKAEIRGCVLRVLCQSETFTKVQVVPGGDPTLSMSPAASHAAAPTKTQAPVPAAAPALPHTH